MYKLNLLFPAHFTLTTIFHITASRLQNQQAWYSAPVISAHRRLRLECGFLGHPWLHSYIVRLCIKNNVGNFFQKKKMELEKHAFNPSTWEVKKDEFLLWDLPGLQNELLQDSQGYTVRPFLGLERWLTGWESILQKKNPTSNFSITLGSSQNPVVPAPERSKTSGLQGHLHSFICAYPAHTHK